MAVLLLAVVVALSISIVASAALFRTGKGPLIWMRDAEMRTQLHDLYPGFRIEMLHRVETDYWDNFLRGNSVFYNFRLASKSVPGLKWSGTYYLKPEWSRAQSSPLSTEVLNRDQQVGLQHAWVREFPGVVLLVGDRWRSGPVTQENPVHGRVAAKYAGVLQKEVYQLFGAKAEEGDIVAYFRRDSRSGKWTYMPGYLLSE